MIRLKIAQFLLVATLFTACGIKQPNIKVENASNPPVEQSVVKNTTDENTNTTKTTEQSTTQGGNQVGQATTAQGTSEQKPVVSAPTSTPPKPAVKPVESKPATKPVQQPSTPSNSSAINGLPAIPSKVPVEYMTSMESEVLTLVNAERSKAGLKPLAMNETLRQASEYKADEMLQYNYFEHTSPYTGQPWDVAKKLGYSYTSFGENIWYMTSTGSNIKNNFSAKLIVDSWMNSPGHRANILNPGFGKMGIGIACSSSGRVYASQMFSN